MLLNTPLQILGTEWIWIVFLVVFLLFGSQKLPELSRALGKAMGEFQRGREEVEREIRAAAMTSYNNPPKVEQHGTTTPIATTPPITNASALAPVVQTPVTTSVTATPAPTVTASTTAAVATPDVTPEKSEPTSEHVSKRQRTTRSKKNTVKTSRPRKKKDNSVAKKV